MRNFTRITAILLALFMTVAAKAKIIENVVIGTFEYYLYDDMTAAVSDLANRNGYGHYVTELSTLILCN